MYLSHERYFFSISLVNHKFACRCKCFIPLGSDRLTETLNLSAVIDVWLHTNITPISYIIADLLGVRLNCVSVQAPKCLLSLCYRLVTLDIGIGVKLRETTTCSKHFYCINCSQCLFIGFSYPIKVNFGLKLPDEHMRLSCKKDIHLISFVKNPESLIFQINHHYKNNSLKHRVFLSSMCILKSHYLQYIT